MQAPSFCLSAREALLSLSALSRAISLLRDPRRRMLALLTLLPAAQAWALPLDRLRQSAREAVDAFCSRASRSSRHDAERLRAHLRSLLAQDPIQDEILDEVEILLAPRIGRFSLEPFRRMLAAGRLEEARTMAHSLPADSHRRAVRRNRALLLCRTGILGRGAHRRFVGRLADALEYPPSLPLFFALCEALVQEDADDSLLCASQQVLARLSERDRQHALGAWSLTVLRREGVPEAIKVLNRIRYQNLRRAAVLRLVKTARTEDLDVDRILRAFPDRRLQREALALLQAPAEPEVEIPARPIDMAPPLAALRHLKEGRLLDPAERKELRRWLHHDSERSAATLLLDDPADQGRWLDEGFLVHVGACLGRETVEHLCYLWMRRRAEILWQQARGAAAAGAFGAGRCLASPPPGDGCSPARTDYDEGLALSRHAPTHRRRLLLACRAILLREARGVGAIPVFIWRIRLRTLGHLPGAETVLEEILDLAAPESELFAAAWRLHAELCPGRAAARLHRDLVHRRPDLGELLPRLELRGALPVGSAEAWDRLEQAATLRLGPGASRWLGEVLAPWCRRSGSFPDSDTLRGLRLEVEAAELPEDGARLIEAALQAVERTLSMAPTEMATALCQDPLLRQRLRWLRPPSLPPGALAWEDPTFVRVLERLPRLGEADPWVLTPLLRALPPRSARLLSRTLPQGRCFLPSGPIQSMGEGFRLRFLDKRLDLHTFLRFADSASCCWQSTNHMYGTTRDRLLRIWLDPASWCMHVERSEGADEAGPWRPTGFVFGSFGILQQDEPVALLNGLYLQPQLPWLRAALLGRLATELSALGLQEAAVASQHGGYGPLPGDWERGTRRVRRLRALRLDGRLVTEAIDDIGTFANQEMEVAHLYWKRLQA